MSSPGERALLADLADVESQRAWERKHAPKAHAMIDRCLAVLDKLPDGEKRDEIKGLIICIGPVARSGRDIDDAYWDGLEEQCEEMLRRAEP